MMRSDPRHGGDKCAGAVCRTRCGPCVAVPLSRCALGGLYCYDFCADPQASDVWSMDHLRSVPTFASQLASLLFFLLASS